MENNELDIRAFRKNILGRSEKKGGLRRNFQSVEDLEKKNRILQRESLVDYLTKIPNEKALDLMINALEKVRERAINSGKKEEINTGTFIAIDLDGLKKVNKTYGRSVGSEYLKTTAKVLKDSVRQEDRVFRNGNASDEFTVYLPKITEESDIYKVLDRFDVNLKAAEHRAREKYKDIKFSLSYVAVRTGIPAGPEFVCWQAHDEMGIVKEGREKLTSERGGNTGRVII